MLVFLGLESIKIVFTLLIKRMIFSVKSTIIKIRVLKLTKFAVVDIIFEVYGVILSFFNTSLYKLLKQHIGQS